MVAFVSSLILSVAMTAGIVWYGKRRPADTYLTWGDAIRGSTFVFALIFLAYGVVPHQFILWADGELNWRADRLIAGPGEILLDLPFDISYQTIRDIIVANIYVVFAVVNMMLWAWWQKRGAPKPAEEIEESTYGRPLVRQEA